MTHLYILKMLMAEIEIICFNFRAQDNSLFNIKVYIYYSYNNGVIVLKGLHISHEIAKKHILDYHLF